jgi:FkbM family methyltransferase
VNKAGILRRRSADERELDRLAGLASRVESSSSLMGGITVVDGPSFVAQFHEIVVREIYSFDFPGAAPVIIDAGANIGVAVLWWRHRWPAARIIAFEPDPQVFRVLAQNLQHHPAVELHQAALSAVSGEITLHLLGADASRTAPDAAHDWPSTQVSSRRLRDVLGGIPSVDLLKIDIEGAELEVLIDSRGFLGTVQRVFIEYHSFAGDPAELATLFDILATEGFTLHLEAMERGVRPFVTQQVDRGINFTCNIWGWRASSAPSVS